MAVVPIARCDTISDAKTVDPVAVGVHVLPTHEPPLLTPDDTMTTSPVFTVGEIPVPLRLTSLGVLGASLAIVIAPNRVPAVVGKKMTLIVQYVPAASVVPQSLVWTKSPLATMLVMLSNALPVLVIVTVCVVLDVPTVCAANADIMLSDTAGTNAGATGDTLLDDADAGPVPAAFVAVTVNVYAVPLVSPVTVIGLAAPIAVIPPGFDVTVYPVIALPPSEVGAVNVTVASALPAVAVPMVGLCGGAASTVIGVR